MGYRVINGIVYPIGQFDNLKESKVIRNDISKKDSFDEVLKKEKIKTEGFKLSNHSALRLKERNIEINEEFFKKINEGINKAKEKGSKESLILYKDVALIASIKNRTIITAMEKEKDEVNVITNIDSVVLL